MLSGRRRSQGCHCKDPRRKNCRLERPSARLEIVRRHPRCSTQWNGRLSPLFHTRRADLYVMYSKAKLSFVRKKLDTGTKYPCGTCICKVPEKCSSFTLYIQKYSRSTESDSSYIHKIRQIELSRPMPCFLGAHVRLTNRVAKCPVVSLQMSLMQGGTFLNHCGLWHA